MPDGATAKSSRAEREAAIKARMGGLGGGPEPEVTAERSERSKRAASDRRRKAPATTARTVRAAPPMPAEMPKPAKLYSARVSHTTTPDQLDALEEVARQARRADDAHRAVPVTAMLRAAASICLDDARMRDRMVRLARTDWR